MSSDDAEKRDRAKRFIAGQTIQSSEPPELFLDRVREDSADIFVDSAVLYYHRAPSIGHFVIGGELKETAHDEAGTLLLTTAYLYFLSHKPKPRSSGKPWYVRLGHQMVDIVRYPVATLVEILKDMVPWLGETISIGTKLQTVLGQTFSARQVRMFKKQFAYEGSFAIPLARIDGLSMSQPYLPTGNLEVSYVAGDDTRKRVRI